MKINYKILCVILALSTAYFAFNRTAGNDAEEAVLENMMTRSSVRSYSDKAISDDTLEKLVKAGMSAPTAGNVQPWEFVIITDKNTLAQYATINEYAAMSPKAAAAIAVVINQESYIDKPHMGGYGPQDAAAASQNILLAAHAMGIGSVWTGVYSEMQKVSAERMAKTSELLKLPPYKTPFAMILLGYPDTEAAPKDKWKPEKITWDR